MFDSVLNYKNKNLLEKVGRLNTVTSMKDVKNITHTQFPGKHCPLTGALLVSRGIKDSLALVVGTDECVYYSKSMTISFAGYGGLHGRVVSVRLDTNDITFGSVEKVEEAFEELVEDYTPSCVFLISTCLIEIIGDDFDALAAALTKKYNLPVLPVHTEHFKCEDHLPGVERALSACTDIMEKTENTNTINILGQRQGEFEKTEVYQILQESGIEINLQLPRECTLDIVKTAPKAKMNLVVNSTAHSLAERMEEKFGTPYVIFDKSSSHETIFKAYKEIFETFGIPLPQKITDKYEATRENFESKRNIFDGLTYIYSASPFITFENNRLLTEFGLEPLLLQVGSVNKHDMEDIKAILEKHNPYVARIPNSPAMANIYETLKPNFSFGIGYPGELEKMNIIPVRFHSSHNKLGFELAELFLEAIDKAHEDYKNLMEKK